MQTNVNGKTISDALAVLKRYAGSGTGSAKGFTLAELRVPDGGGTLIIRRWAWKTFTDVSASIMANGGTAGTAYVAADALTDAVKGTKGMLTLTVDNDRLTVTSENGGASLRLENGADFPAPMAFPPRPFAVIADGERDAMRGVVAAAAGGSDARAVLTGVNFDHNEGEAVTTDTYRMHAGRLRAMHASGIIPADVLRIGLATGSGPLELHADEAGKRFLLTYRMVKGTKNAPRIVAVSAYGMMIEGPFPNYAAIVQPARDHVEYEWTVTDAAGTADVARSFADNRNTPLMLSAAAGSAVLASATYPENGTREASPPIVTDGKTDVLASIAFNPTYFADAVKHAGDGAPIRFRDPMRAAYFDGGDRYALLMPMRVS